MLTTQHSVYLCIMKPVRIVWVLYFLLVWSACKDKKESVLPTEGPIIEAVYASGFVKSQNQYQVFPKSGGTIRKLLVQKGDFVKKGQIIASISSDVSRLNAESAGLNADFSDYDANTNRIREAKVGLELAAKKLKSDSLVYQRQKRLWNDQIGTKYELEQRELQYANSRTTYEAAYFRLKELERQLKFNAAQSKKNEKISRSLLADFDVRSEVDGKIYALLKEEGEMTGPQSPLALIGDALDFIVVLQVDENDITRLQAGQKIQVTLESYKGQVFEAVVQKIFPLMNERTRSFEVEAVFVKAPDVLFPNLSVEANIIITQKEKALTIPRNYLTDQDEVWISDKEKRKIKTGLRDYNRVEVLEGLKPTEPIYAPR